MTGHDTPPLRIASTRPGLWRCGVQHPAEAVIHPAGTFSAEQVERLRAEPALVVDVVDGDGRPEGGAAAPAPSSLAASMVEALGHLSAEQLARLSGMTPEEIDVALGLAEPQTPAAEGGGGRERKQLIAAAAAALDPENPDHWNADGTTPSIKALEAATGLDDISADERDEAHAAVLAAQGGGE